MAARRRDSRAQPDEPVPRFSRTSARRAMRLFRYIRPYRLAFGFGMVLLTLSSLVFMVFPIASGEILEVANGKGSYGLTLNEIGIGLLIILVIQSGISFTRVNLFTYMSEHAGADLREDLFRKLVSLPITFFEENRAGELTARTAGDVQQVQDVLSLTSAEFLRQIIILAAGISWLFYKTSNLAILMFATFPVIVILAMFIGRYIRRLSKDRQDLLARANVVLDETLQSVMVVKTFTNEWFEILRFRKENRSVVRQSMRLGMMRSLFIAFVIAIMFGVIFYVLWRGAVMVQQGLMPTGDLVAFIAITAIIGGAIGSLGELFTQVLRGIGASERIMDILDMSSEIQPADHQGTRQPARGKIELRHLTFAYPSRPDMPVLHNLDLSIHPGQKIALVGSSGAGKSTIVQLILRLYPTASGTIYLDGRDIQDLDLTAYRRHFAIVPQEVMLFGGTIRENIRYGNTEATDDQVIRAAEQSNSMEFIRNFPLGLETVVGERGVKLSGGQRQRIAIARAILRDPDILILDEATSSLDAESEAVVQEALDRLLEGRTAIIIAHRLATIRHVDRICVLEHGAIVETGTHDELLRHPEGRYAQLARLQFDLPSVS